MGDTVLFVHGALLIKCVLQIPESKYILQMN